MRWDIPGKVLRPTFLFFDEVASDVSGVRYLKEKLGDYLSDETADGLELIMSSVEGAKECDFKLQFTPTLVKRTVLLYRNNF